MGIATKPGSLQKIRLPENGTTRLEKNGIEMRRLALFNFQKHKEISIPLDNPITCIVGESDKGKSAIIRALRWAAFNKPGGSGFIRYGEKSCSVKLRIDDHRIARIRNGKENKYIVDGEKLEAFGSTVPDQVSVILKLDEINFQKQFDAPFWFSESAGEVSKRLNAIVDLSVLDRLMANLNARLRKASAKKDLLTEQFESIQIAKAQAREIIEIDKRLIAVELLANEVKSNAQKRARLNDCIAGVVRIGADKKRLTLALESGKNLIRISDRAERIGKQRESISELIDTAQKHDARIKRLSGSLPTAQEIKALESEMSKLKKAEKDRDGIAAQLITAKANRTEICRLEKETKLLKEQFSRTLGKKCPMCGNAIRS